MPYHTCKTQKSVSDKARMVGAVSSFLSSTSLHALPHLPGSSSWEKVLWIATVIATLSTGVFLCNGWDHSTVKEIPAAYLYLIIVKQKTPFQTNSKQSSFNITKLGLTILPVQGCDSIHDINSFHDHPVHDHPPRPSNLPQYCAL